MPLTKAHASHLTPHASPKPPRGCVRSSNLLDAICLHQLDAINKIFIHFHSTRKTHQRPRFFQANPPATMAWPYGFPSLTHEEKLLRRQTLDLYACIAHYSALVPALLFLLYRLLKRVASQVKSGSSSEQTRYSVVPNSPTVKAQLQRPSARFASQWRNVVWWFSDDVYFLGLHWGQKDEWVLGTIWTAWLLVLSIKGTGNGKMHPQP